MFEKKDIVELFKDMYKNVVHNADISKSARNSFFPFFLNITLQDFLFGEMKNVIVTNIS